MAISTGAAVEFFGSQTTLNNTTAAVSNNAFSVAGDVNSWANTDDAPQASMILLANFSVAPDANSSINLYAKLDNIEGTNDQDIPDANFQHTYLGSFPLNDVTTAQYINIGISLPNTVTSQDYIFYIENKSGQSLPLAWDLFITPKTIGPHA